MTRASPLVLAIDLGTSRCKAALVDRRGRVVSGASLGVDTVAAGADGVEQDARGIWRVALAAAARAMREGKAARSRVLGIGLTSQFSSIVPVDRSGRPLMNMILWMDRRGGTFVRRMCERHAEAPDAWVDIHGRRPSPAGGQSLAHLLFVKNARPYVYDAARAFLEPMDYLAMKLTGECCASPCTAFPSMLTDNRDREATRYHPRLLELSGIDHDKLPPLLATNSRIGKLRRHVASALGLPESTAVFSGTADTQAASVAAGTFAADQGGINIGSTAQILAQASGKKTDSDRDLLTMPSPIRADWLVLAENGVAGKALDLFLRDVVFANDSLANHSSVRPFAGLDRTMRATKPGSEGLLFLPWITGSEAPAPNDKVRGAFINISMTTNRELMVRAVLEGIAFSLRWLRDAVESFGERKLNNLRFCGGGARSDNWAQIVADVMGQSIHQLKGAEFTGCRAAAFLAFERLELIGLADHDDFFPVRRRFEPLAGHRDVYDCAYEKFLLGFRCNVPLFEALNG